MTFATYAPIKRAHPTRTGAHRSTAAIRLLILHTSEGSEGLISAENLTVFIASPRSATNLASYHYVFDTDCVRPCVPDDYVAYATGGANHDGLAACYPGKAYQSAAEWNDEISNLQHEQAARWLADKALQYGIPLVRLTPAQIVAGQRGVCGHVDVTNAYHKSTHTDPGPHFPWDKVIDRARQFTSPIDPTPGLPMEDDMVLIITCNDGVDTERWVTNGPTKSWIPDGAALAALQFTLQSAGKDGTVHSVSPEQFRGYGVSSVQYPGRDAWGVRIV